MKSRSLSCRGLLLAGTGLLIALAFEGALMADDADWQPAGTRQRFGSNLEPKTTVEKEATVEEEMSSAAAKQKAHSGRGEPRRIDRKVAGNAQPIRRARRPAPTVARRTPSRAARVNYEAPPRRTAPARAKPVRPAVALQAPSSQGAHRTVSYHARPYPLAPLHPHPYYSAYTSGAFPGRFVSHAQPESIMSGEIVPAPGGALEPEPAPEVWGEGEYHEFEEGFYEDGLGYDGGCGCGELDCGGCCHNPLFASLLFGVQGFKDTLDIGHNGNFGFQQGFEVAIPSPFYPVGIQFGMRFTQNNIHGDRTTREFRDDGHEQMFLTTGLFKRANCCPWQYGVVFDWRHDNYFVESDLSQIRFELSRKNCWGNEFGFLMGLRTSDENFSDVDDVDVDLIDDIFDELGDSRIGLRSTDYYTVFWRRPTEILGEWRFMAGITGDSAAILGGDFWLPVGRCLALEGDWGYLIPDKRRSLAQREDAYALGLNIVWYPYRTPQRVADHPYRPVMPVANNARFFPRLKLRTQNP